MERATIQNLLGGTVTITAGTIVGVNQQAISNEGILTIGQKGGNISTTSPIIQGKTSGLKTNGTLNFYDGIIKGRSSSVIDGTINELEENVTPTNGNEVINGVTYNTIYLS